MLLPSFCLLYLFRLTNQSSRVIFLSIRISELVSRSVLLYVAIYYDVELEGSVDGN